MNTSSLFASLLVAAVVVAAPAAAAEPGAVRVHTLPGATAFPESIGVDQRTGAFYTGSFIDGGVARGTLGAGSAQVFLPAGSDGRTAVAGVKVDRQGRIWMCDAFNGRVLVYDEQGELLHSYVLEGAGQPLVNDIAFAGPVAYVTDSSRPFLYRLDVDAATAPGVTPVQPWLDVTPAVTYHTGEGPFGINLNGIVASPDGQTLLSVQTNTGLLFRVRVASREIDSVTVGGSSLLFGDGLLRIGDSLFVARNAANEIVKLKLGHGWRSVEAQTTLTNRDLPASAQLAFPTGVRRARGRLLVTNAQLNAQTPILPFTVLDLPLSGTGRSGSA